MSLFKTPTQEPERTFYVVYELSVRLRNETGLLLYFKTEARARETMHAITQSAFVTFNTNGALPEYCIAREHVVKMVISKGTRDQEGSD